MKYRFSGQVDADIVFTTPNELHIVMAAGNSFQMPDEKSLGKLTHGFSGMITGSSPEDAMTRARQFTTQVCKMLGLELSMHVDEPQISRIEPINLPAGDTKSYSIGIATMSASAYLVRGFT